MSLDKDMPLEIEIKMKVDSFDQTLDKLKALGAEFEGDFLQTDSYYDDDEDSLISSDRCLRIRKHKNHIGETVELTYKGQRMDHRFKTRREIGLKVESAEELATVFENLGYKERLTFEKKRGLWLIDDCKVALDELPLIGKFIEIEGPSDVIIESVQKKLGLDNFSHMPKSYAHLIEDEIKKQKITGRKISFK